MIFRYGVYHAIQLLDYFAADEKLSLNDFCLPVGWVLSGPLPLSSYLVSTCFKTNLEQNFEHASKEKSWYDMELYDALKQKIKNPPQTHVQKF